MPHREARTIEPERRLQIRAFIALIERELEFTHEPIPFFIARKLLEDLENAGHASFRASPVSGTLTMFGISETSDSDALGHLRNWVRRAKRALAEAAT